MNLLLYIILIVNILYGLYILFILTNSGKANYSLNEETFFASVIIPIRNEVKNIPRLIQELMNQKKVNLEIIFIDDHSEDETINVLKQQNNTIQYLCLDNASFGKKAAIECGINAAHHPTIITIDADIHIPSDNWAHQLLSNKKNKKTDLEGGAVFIKPKNNLWSIIQEIENWAIQYNSAAFANIGFPMTISGANLCVDKSAFTTAQPFQDNKSELSGDDIYLLQGLKKNERAIGISLSNFVWIKESGFLQYFSQRIRWMKKKSGFNQISAVLLALLLFLTNISFIVGICFALIHRVFEPILLISLSIKIGFDFLFLFLVALERKRLITLLFFIPAELFNIFAFTFIMTIGWFIPVKWKGRKIKWETK